MMNNIINLFEVFDCNVELALISTYLSQFKVDCAPQFLQKTADFLQSTGHCCQWSQQLLSEVRLQQGEAEVPLHHTHMLERSRENKRHNYYIIIYTCGSFIDYCTCVSSGSPRRLA